MEEQQALEIANFRYRLISPIVSRQNLPPGQIQALIGEAAKKTYSVPYSSRTTVSVRSIERYLQDYRTGGFEALKPKERSGRQSRIPEQYLELAAILRKENPKRSCCQIIKTLECLLWNASSTLVIANCLTRLHQVLPTQIESFAYTLQ